MLWSNQELKSHILDLLPKSVEQAYRSQYHLWPSDNEDEYEFSNGQLEKNYYTFTVNINQFQSNQYWFTELNNQIMHFLGAGWAKVIKVSQISISPEGEQKIKLDLDRTLLFTNPVEKATRIQSFPTPYMLALVNAYSTAIATSWARFVGTSLVVMPLPIQDNYRLNPWIEGDFIGTSEPGGPLVITDRFIKPENFLLINSEQLERTPERSGGLLTDYRKFVPQLEDPQKRMLCELWEEASDKIFSSYFQNWYSTPLQFNGKVSWEILELQDWENIVVSGLTVDGVENNKVYTNEIIPNGNYINHYLVSSENIVGIITSHAPSYFLLDSNQSEERNSSLFIMPRKFLTIPGSWDDAVFHGTIVGKGNSKYKLTVDNLKESIYTGNENINGFENFAQTFAQVFYDMFESWIQTTHIYSEGAPQGVSNPDKPDGSIKGLVGPLYLEDFEKGIKS